MQDRVVGELDAVDDPDRVEDVDVVVGLGVVDDLGDLEPAGDDELAVLGPDGGWVVDGVSLGGDLEQQLELGGAVAKPLGELLAKVVAAALLGLVVGDRGPRPPPGASGSGPRSPRRRRR